MDQLRAMHAFARVAESGSFVSASRALAVAPSIVTRAVADLEHHLGARLMTRTTRRLALTEVGATYLERVRQILREIDDAAAQVQQSQAEPHGVVRVLAPAAFAAYQLTRRLARFHELHPQVTIELDAAPEVETLDPAHEVSIVIKAAPLDGDFVARRLASVPVIACAAPAYLDRHGRPAHPRELEGHALLMAPHDGALSLRHLEGELATVALKAPCLQSPNLDLHRAGAIAGLGIAALPAYAVEQALEKGLLERALPGWQLKELTIWACMPTRRHVSASTRAFMDFLLAQWPAEPLRS